MIIDANNAVLGRTAAKVAKEVLKGNQVTVVNVENIVISGNPDATIKKFQEKLKRGDPKKGPFYPKYPDRVFRRIVRGMLPFKKAKGRNAFRRLKVQMGNPENLKGETISKTSDDLRCKYITLRDLCKRLGAKIG